MMLLLSDRLIRQGTEDHRGPRHGEILEQGVERLWRTWSLIEKTCSSATDTDDNRGSFGRRKRLIVDTTL